MLEVEPLTLLSHPQERSLAASTGEATWLQAYEQMTDTGPLAWMWSPPSPGPGARSSSLDEAAPWALESPAQPWVGLGPEAMGAPEDIFVLLFGVGESDMEGIYSLRAVSPEGLPVDTIVAFADEVAATRYATLLEASMEHTPHVCSIPWHELEDFCHVSGYCCRLEPADSLLMPPEKNVQITDWERTLRLRQGDLLAFDGFAGALDSDVEEDVLSLPTSDDEEAAPHICFDVESARAMLERLYCSAAP